MEYLVKLSLFRVSKVHHHHHHCATAAETIIFSNGYILCVCASTTHRVFLLRHHLWWMADTISGGWPLALKWAHSPFAVFIFCPTGCPPPSSKGKPNRVASLTGHEQVVQYYMITCSRQWKHWKHENIAWPDLVKLACNVIMRILIYQQIRVSWLKC